MVSRGKLAVLVVILFSVVPAIVDPFTMPLCNLIAYPIWMVMPLAAPELQVEKSIKASVALSADEYDKAARALETKVA